MILLTFMCCMYFKIFVILWLYNCLCVMISLKMAKNSLIIQESLYVNIIFIIIYGICTFSFKSNYNLKEKGWKILNSLLNSFCISLKYTLFKKLECSFTAGFRLGESPSCYTDEATPCFYNIVEESLINF